MLLTTFHGNRQMSRRSCSAGRSTAQNPHPEWKLSDG